MEPNVNSWEALLTMPTSWQWLGLLWVLSLSWYGFRLNRTREWFKEPITTKRQFWEYGSMAVLLTFLDTDLLVDGLLATMKWHYLKEWWKQDKVLGVSLVLGASLVLFLLVLSPYIGI